MSLFDRLRPKWKHPDPSVREGGVRELTDQTKLESIADNDLSDAVRLAAVQTMTDQETLARLARGNTPLALAAMQRLTDPRHVAAVAFVAECSAVRELAIEQINDGVMLHRISACDTGAWVRLKARMKSMEPNQTRDVIKRMLSKLQLAHQQRESGAEFRGSLDDVSGALLRDRRFRVNGGVETTDPDQANLHEPAKAGTETSRIASTSAGEMENCAQFLAFKRGDSGEAEDTSKSKAYFQIKIWRTAPDEFAGTLEEKRLEVATDLLAWSRASGDGVIRPGPAS